MTIEEKIKEFGMCVWRKVADNDNQKDKNGCIYKTFPEYVPCKVCDGLNIYCHNYFANGVISDKE